MYSLDDTTSRTGTKAAPLKASYHLLASFGQNRRPIFLSLKQTEKHLCSVLYLTENCNAFDDLRYTVYYLYKEEQNGMILTTYF